MTKIEKEVIEKLYSQFKFEDIIRDFSASNDPEIIYYVLTSYVSLNKIGEAYEYYLSKTKIIEKVNFEVASNYLCLILSLLDDSYLVEKEFNRVASNYKGIKADEVLKKLELKLKQFKDINTKLKKSELKDNEKNKLKIEYQYLEMLNSKNVEEVLNAMKYINSNFKNQYSQLGLIYYQSYEKRKEFDPIKALFLAQLIALGYDKNLSLYKNSKFYYFNPKDVNKYYILYSQKINQTIDVFSKNEKNVNIISDVILQFMLMVYYHLPNILKDEELYSLLYIALKHNYELLGQKIEDDEYASNLPLDLMFISQNYDNKYFVDNYINLKV